MKNKFALIAFLFASAAHAGTITKGTCELDYCEGKKCPAISQKTYHAAVKTCKVEAMTQAENDAIAYCARIGVATFADSIEKPEIYPLTNIKGQTIGVHVSQTIFASCGVGKAKSKLIQ